MEKEKEDHHALLQIKEAGQLAVPHQKKSLHQKVPQKEGESLN